ncbi:Oxysterol-binding protein 2 [Orchesella cincta]|uniref:Oxysterol-binding protein n=1 Tax=Orchesella cincta TaxID=48709 RepID=A0A1D2N3P1_ORCCI|nr:Oxysterol-binding protein 2 [Orchesella cincta]
MGTGSSSPPTPEDLNYRIQGDTNDTSLSQSTCAIIPSSPAGSEQIITIWSSSTTGDLVEGEIDFEDMNETDNPPTVTKKKKCRCCCCRRKHRSLSGNPDETCDCEVQDIITLRSADERLIASEVFPLEMVASLDLTPAAVQNKPTKKRRTRVQEKPDRPMSLWNLIKSAIGKDLTKFPLPVNFSEPLSMLQRLAEDYEYCAILDKASVMTDSLEQLASVAAFTVSAYATCALRTAKPFNPLLGETYEFDRTDDLGWRCISEQVCHHPPVAALHCESAYGWVQWQQFTMTSKFRGNYLEIFPLGVAHLRFKTSENHYTWRKVTTVVRNLIVGRLYIEQEGDMEILNHSTNEKCVMKYSAGSMFSRSRQVYGKIFNSSNVPVWELNGTWDIDMSATKLDSNGKPIPDTTRVLWKRNPLPSDAEKYYNFSLFACQLNEIEDDVAPTDTRNRPDQRFMENGQWDEANVEKTRLEDKQREIRRQRVHDANTKLSTNSNLKSIKSAMPPAHGAVEEGVEPFYTPAWFIKQQDPISGHLIHLYNNEYWECKHKKDWKRCPKLYDS